MTKTAAKATKTNKGKAARRFECEDGASKFWEVRIDGDQLHISWGKLGTGGQSQTKSFPSAEKAKSEQDKLIAEKTKKGYAEVGASVPATPAKPPAMKTAEASAPKAATSPAKKKTAPAPAPALESAPRTFDDFRDETLKLVREKKSRPEAMVALIVEWSHAADDARVMQWIEQLNPKEGWQSLAAGLVAVVRARTDKASAARFIAAAEAALPDEGYAKSRGLEGLVPAWWRLGKQAQGDKGFAAVKAHMATDDLEAAEVTHTLFGLAALGGQRPLLEKLLPATMKVADHEGPLRTALPALLADGFDKVFETLMKKWKSFSSSESDTSRVLLAYLLREGRPEQFLELALRCPTILHNGNHLRVALCALEKADATTAVALSSKLLASADMDKKIQVYALAVLATHAAAKADAWAKRSPELTKPGKESCLPYLAALGRTDVVRKALKDVEPGANCLGEIAQVTPDRALAIEALQQKLDPSKGSSNAQVLVWMHDLGDPACVETCFKMRLEQERALKATDRDGCRAIARAAGMVGRIDLALTAVALPSKDEQRYVAQHGVEGCAIVGDWTGAFTLLAKDTLETVHGRVHSAVHALTKASEAPFDGPRSVPLRVTAA